MPTINVLIKNKKNITIFNLKIIIFKAVKNRSILHGRVFVMNIYGDFHIMSSFSASAAHSRKVGLHHDSDMQCMSSDVHAQQINLENKQNASEER